MTVPDYQSIMLPLLRMLADGQPHRISDLVQELGDAFRLTDEEKNTIYPGGRKYIFDDRVGWARTYMGQAGLLENTARGVIRITDVGQLVLQDGVDRIDVKLLSKFPSFAAFKQRTRNRTTTEEINVSPADEILKPEELQTPEDALESSYLALRRQLQLDLLDNIKRCSPKFFEQLVIDTLVAMGYGGSRQDAGQAIGRSGDGGIDGIIKEDRLGLDTIYVQAKRWEGTVGRPVVQAFTGSLEGYKARKGIIITTSQFSNDAVQYVNIIEKRIVLIDGLQLTEYMIDYGVGVNEVSKYVVKKLDMDYFVED